MRTTQEIREKRERLQTQFFGVTGEPKLDSKSTKVDLINFLNWHSQLSEPSQSKGWTLDWIKSQISMNDFLLVDKLNEQWFSNYGFVIRASEMGFPMSNDTLTEIKNSVVNLAKEKVFIAPTIKKSKQQALSQQLETIEYNIDLLLSGDDDLIGDIDFTGINNSQKNLINQYLDSLQADINKDQQEEEPGYNKEKATSLLSYISELRSSMAGVKVVKTRTRKVSPEKQKAKEKTKIHKVASRQPYLATWNGFKSVKPIELIGKTEALFYSTQTGKITRLFSESPTGFTIEGKKVHGFNNETSGAKRFTRTDKMTGISQSHRSINRFYLDIKNTETKATVVFSEQLIILSIK